MNENEKELNGINREFTESPANEGTTNCTVSTSVDETKLNEAVCAETESPALSIADIAEKADPDDNSETSVEEQENIDTKDAAEALARQAELEAAEGKISEAENTMKEAEKLMDDAETSEAKKTDEKINYHSFSKSELVGALRHIIDTNDVMAHKKVASIKQSFYLLRNREIEAEMEEYVDNGNSPDTFTASIDETEVEIKELLAKFREMRSDYLSAEESRRQENLTLKLKIINQLRELAEDIDNINLHFPKFQQLQADFKAITDIPAGDVADTWKNYQLSVEQFYDRLKMNKELRDLDFRKNLEYKRQLIDQAKALETEPDPVAAFRKLQELHEKWRETGPVAKEIREEIWDEFKAASTKVNKRHQDFFEARKAKETANEEAKIKLCEELETIDMDNLNLFKDWDKETKHVLELQEQWKTLGFASRKVNTQLFNRFRKKCDEFFQRKGEYFKSIKDEYANNLAQKTALCEAAEALREKETDYKKAIDRISKMQAEWRKIGPVARKNSDAIWERFNAACNYFYEQRKSATSALRQEENANLAAKRAIITALKAIDIEELERNQAVAQVRELQKQWNQTGHVPYRQKDTLFAEYRQVCDSLYSSLDMRHQQQRMSSFEEELAGMDSDKAKMMREREKLSRAYESKKNELNTAENNLGFFNIKSSAGSTMLRDMERRIKRLREDLELISQKISAINQKMQ